VALVTMCRRIDNYACADPSAGSPRVILAGAAAPYAASQRRCKSSHDFGCERSGFPPWLQANNNTDAARAGCADTLTSTPHFPAQSRRLRHPARILFSFARVRTTLRASPGVKASPSMNIVQSTRERSISISIPDTRERSGRGEKVEAGRNAATMPCRLELRRK